MDVRSKASERILWWWFSGTRGGPTRARIVMAVKNEPLNAKQLSDLLGLNYKTVRNHLRILGKNGFLVTFGEKYGRAYSPSSELLANFEVFERVQRAGRILNRRELGREMRALG